jgi:putative transposase
MGRAPRITEPGVAYHLLNRRVMRLTIFEKEEDYAAFERVLAEGLGRPDAPKLLAYCVMPNHWHLVGQAGDGTDLSTWMQWVAVTHTHRWHAHHHSAGEGPLYQGRFKSFPVQEDAHFLTLCRYVEANPLRAHLVDRAEDWRWSSLWARRHGEAGLGRWLKPWPVEPPRDWLAAVNRPMNEEELKAVRQSAGRGLPLGTDRWKTRIAERLGLTTTLRPRGRPRKQPEKSS